MKFEIPNQGKIIGYFGEDNQLLYCKEQLEEMIHAVSEMRRIKISGENSSEAYENLVEGFADVLISLAQLQEIYEIPNHMIQNLIYRRSSEQENWIVDIREHAVTGVPQEEFDQKAAAYDERFRKADAKLNRLKAEKQDRLMRVCSVKKYVENLRGQAGPIDVWNEQAWCLLVTQVTVHADGSAEFLFRGENRIMVK